MSNFLFLFRGGTDTYQTLSQEDKELHMRNWQKWLGQLSEQGKLVDGLPLANEGKVVEDRGEIITEGPFAEGNEIVGGYLVVSAEDMNEAVEISGNCPIFGYSKGTVEIREILSLDM